MAGVVVGAAWWRQFNSPDLARCRLGGRLADMKEEDFHFLMNVNLYGPYRVTKAFSPLIVASKGRITTIARSLESSRAPTPARTA